MQNRNQSLDLFRGLTVAFMVIVNNPGSWSHIFAVLKHAKWDGLYGADLVFPFFLVAVGMSVPFALQKRLDQSAKKSSIVFHILTRSFVLFALGMVLNGFPDYNWDSIRIPGVLQRIAVVYLATCLSFLYLKESQRVAIFALVMVGYSIAIVEVPPPGWAGDRPFLYSPSDNLAAFWDRKILGGHLWVYSKTWDPEGILSTLPAIGSAYWGLWMSLYGLGTAPRIRIPILGLLGLALGGVLHFYFPINKSLWSPAYVLVTGGIACLFFSALEWARRPRPNFGPISNPNSFSISIAIPIARKTIVTLGTHALFVFFTTGILSRSLTTTWPGWERSVKAWILENGFRWGDPYWMSALYSFAYLLAILPLVWTWIGIRRWLRGSGKKKASRDR